VDEYQLEIDSLRRTLERLRIEEAAPDVIDEYDVELRILRALYEAAERTIAAGERDPRLAGALERLGFGRWELPNVYSFIYDAAMDAGVGGLELAALIGETDHAAQLLTTAGELN
jgi:hypothetical protein